ncbi:DUF4244 domain-containing protein [Planobispora rosea]|uniref:DUF4244 domain-containing protein n=1 Tax=Planobispora rosea TaxID=35762 RepID=UPI0009FC391D
MAGPRTGGILRDLRWFGLGGRSDGEGGAGGILRDLRSLWRARWSLLTSGTGRERGMSTAEYAVGTIAACAFAALLFKVVTSPEVQEMITNLINRALNVAG